MKYCYPKLSDRDYLYFRLLGPGLGNLLFPWARAAVYAHKNGLEFIAPTWPQIKFGTIIRRELDARTYWGLFNSSKSDVSGIRRVLILLLSKRVVEKHRDSADDGAVIEFAGMTDLFADIIHDHIFVKKKILEITRVEQKAGLHFDFANSICAHIRLGDFKADSNLENLKNGQNNTRVPISWYRDVLYSLSSASENKKNIYIFSDGTDAELQEVLQLPRARRMTFGSAIADILALSASEILVASGSTFSMWAAYLGRMPMICFPGQLKQKIYLNEWEHAAEVSDGASAKAFIEAINLQARAGATAGNL